MTLSRRRFLHLAGTAAALPPFARLARAQTYPSRPVRLFIGFAAGATGDIVSRLMGQWLSQRLGQPFIVENRPGAGTNVATDAVVRAAPDGYTLLYVSPANTINATLYEKLSFNFLRDIAPVARIGSQPNAMLVNPLVPARTVPDFIAYAKANPGKINMASSGNGTSVHVSGELFKMMAGIDMVHVPYRGSAPALTDLIGGQVQVMFDGVPASIEHIKTGKLRALAVTTATRLEVLPDIPTVGEFVPGYETSAWQGIGTPANTPAEIIERLNKEINAGLSHPKIRARLADLGNTALPGSPAEFGKFVAEETDKWAKVIRFAGIKPD
jgi:tripartite-type tricarboxylate transporter receptor subunit TctC